MTQFKVTVFTPNKILKVRSKIIRTPVVMKVSSQELSFIEKQLKAYDVKAYKVERITESQKPNINIPPNIPPTIEDIEPEEEINDTILTKLAANEDVDLENV